MKIKVGFSKKVNKYPHLLIQKKLVEQHYTFLSCSIKKEVLTCTGYLQPPGCKDRYKVKVEYVTGNEPKCTIVQPKIDPCKEIHMYNDNSVCLHYAPDMFWDEKINFYQYTIPWLSEWIVFYERYLENGGVWEGRESPSHIKESDKNINIDKD